MDMDYNPRRPETIGVAVAALLSLIATTFMFCYAGFLHFMVRHDREKYKPQSQIYRDQPGEPGYAHAMRFLRSHSGRFFLNLVLADWIQSFGFMLNLTWAGGRSDQVHLGGKVCTLQGVAIQIGDTASAFWVTAIAIHTMFTLAFRKRLAPWGFYAIVVSIWTAIVMFALLGPAALHTDTKGPYYGPAGAWCWIGREYTVGRLYLHYLFIFIAIIVNAVCHIIVFFSIRAQSFKSKSLSARYGPATLPTVVPHSHSHSESQSSSPSQGDQGGNRHSKTLSSGSDTIASKSQTSSDDKNHMATTLKFPAKAAGHRLALPTQSASYSQTTYPRPFINVHHRSLSQSQYNHQQSIIDRTAWKMLWYPPVYLILCLPLATFRLAGIAGHNWGYKVQVLSGCLFTLAGLANVALYWVTRNMSPGIGIRKALRESAIGTLIEKSIKRRRVKADDCRDVEDDGADQVPLPSSTSDLPLESTYPLSSSPTNKTQNNSPPNFQGSFDSVDSEDTQPERGNSGNQPRKDLSRERSTSSRSQLKAEESRRVARGVQVDIETAYIESKAPQSDEGWWNGDDSPQYHHPYSFSLRQQSHPQNSEGLEGGSQLLKSATFSKHSPVSVGYGSTGYGFTSTRTTAEKPHPQIPFRSKSVRQGPTTPATTTSESSYGSSASVVTFETAIPTFRAIPGTG